MCCRGLFAWTCELRRVQFLFHDLMTFLRRSVCVMDVIGSTLRGYCARRPSQSGAPRGIMLICLLSKSLCCRKCCFHYPSSPSTWTSGSTFCPTYLTTFQACWTSRSNSYSAQSSAPASTMFPVCCFRACSLNRGRSSCRVLSNPVPVSLLRPPVRIRANLPGRHRLPV